MLLTQLTNYASVVIGPTVEIATVKSLQLVRLSSHHITVVVVLSNGAVENEQIEVGLDISDEEISLATSKLQNLMLNTPLRDVPKHRLVNRKTSDAATELSHRVLEALDRTRNDETFFVGGAAQMAEAFDAVEIVRNVLHTLEQQYVVVTLVRDMLNRGLSVAIGAEHGVEPLSACSVVLAPVMADGESVGTVGVLGPTRMNYPQALATVELVSDRLGRRLTEN
jgi:heat-inducible transcriptional repressor